MFFHKSDLRAELCVSFSWTKATGAAAESVAFSATALLTPVGVAIAISRTMAAASADAVRVRMIPKRLPMIESWFGRIRERLTMIQEKFGMIQDWFGNVRRMFAMIQNGSR